MDQSQNNNQPTQTVQNNQPAYETIFCSTCGAKIAKVAVSCPHCGAPVAQNQQQPQIIINNANTNTNSNVNANGVVVNGKNLKNKWVAFLPMPLR